MIKKKKTWADVTPRQRLARAILRDLREYMDPKGERPPGKDFGARTTILTKARRFPLSIRLGVALTEATSGETEERRG